MDAPGIALTQWMMTRSPAGAFATPEDIGDARWMPADVPGTAAHALEIAGEFDRSAPLPLHLDDIWYRCEPVAEGSFLLTCEGLATLAELWLDGRRIGASESMFAPFECPVHLTGKSRIYIVFRALTAESAPKASRRQKWRVNLIADSHMRQTRATLLGHMPGWCPPIVPVGPVRPVTLRPLDAPHLRIRKAASGYDNGVGTLDIALELQGKFGNPELACAGISAPLVQQGDGLFTASLRIPGVRPWWPHTHGEPVLHPVTVISESGELPLGKTGFRSISVDRGTDGRGFGLVVNGVPVFCRGVNWTPPDIVALPCSRASYEPLLRRVREAGMTMIRVPGIMTYEGRAFAEMADELGILCWYDLMFANFDYDFGDPRFAISVKSELAAFFERSGLSPSLAVVCGGSEVMQQAAMLGLPEANWRVSFFAEDLPGIVAAHRPDAVPVANSPSGGDLPFAVDAGVSHYYGVGAYRQPLEDARRAGPRFASECLAFANLPQPEAMPALDPATAEWEARVVHDLGADWDFEDVRDHYLRLLYGADPDALRRDDPARYVALSQAVSGEVMEAAFAEWRRVGSVTAGALVWLLKDPGDGFGWGILDHRARPKPAYYALKRAFRPVQVLLTDEGVNGLHVHVLNETGEPRRLDLHLACHDASGAVVIDGQRRLDLPARGALRLTSAQMFGVFFDATYTYRFGPPAHEVTVARLSDADTGEQIAEAFHFPRGRAAAIGDDSTEPLVIRAAGHAPVTIRSLSKRRGLSARLDVAGDETAVVLHAPCLMQSVHIAASGLEPEEDWFHLAPGRERRISLRPT